MKAYLLDTLSRYKRFSENLDVRTTLCNKSWWVFNDCGEKEVYIFEEDGSLIISVSGKVTNATWRYMSANKSLIINAKDQSYMLNPAFMDGVIFALQLDGTDECFFMIDEGNTASFKPKSLTELSYYFERKEQILVEESDSAKRLLKQQQLKEKQIELNRQKEELAAEQRKKEWKAILTASSRYRWTKIICNVTALLIALTLTYFTSINASDKDKAIVGWAMLPPISYGLLMILFNWFIIDTVKDNVLDNYYKNK